MNEESVLVVSQDILVGRIQKIMDLTEYLGDGPEKEKIIWECINILMDSCEHKVVPEPTVDGNVYPLN